MLFAGRRAGPAAPVLIGVAGLGHNTGTTTLCIALANYLCSKRRKATAYLELGAPQIKTLSGRSFQSLVPHKENSYHTVHAGKLKSKPTEDGPAEYFRLQEIDLYPQVPLHRLTGLCRSDYRYCILDFGVITPLCRSAFMRCDLRILVCDLAPWKQEQTHLLLQQLTADRSLQSSIIVLGRGSSSRHFLFSSSEYAYRFLNFPHLPNPFQVTPEVFDFFEKLLTGV